MYIKELKGFTDHQLEERIEEINKDISFYEYLEKIVVNSKNDNYQLIVDWFEYKLIQEMKLIQNELLFRKNVIGEINEYWRIRKEN